VKDLPKVPTWRMEWDSNLRPKSPLRRKVSARFNRVVVPPTSLLHPGREAADGPRLLISREIPAYLAASLYI